MREGRPQLVQQATEAPSLDAVTAIHRALGNVALVQVAERTWAHMLVHTAGHNIYDCRSVAVLARKQVVLAALIADHSQTLVSVM